MDGDQRRSFSLLRGDGLYFNRIISRKSSVGQSSRIYYRTGEGVPFKWEMQPGTSKNPPEEEEESTPFPFPFPPLSPPPQLQNKSLPLPNPCLDQDQPKNHNKFFCFLKRSKISELYGKLAYQSSSRRRCTCTGNQNANRYHGDFTSSLVNHSCSSSSTLSSSRNDWSSSSSSSSSSVIRESVDDAPFCCSPWNVTAIMEEGNRRIYYCRDHKTAFAVEKDGSFLSKIILSRVSSSVDHQSSFHRIGEGIPFQWETKPGRPIDPPEEEVIPPPTPPPALQSLLVTPPLPSPRSHDSVKTNKSKGIFWNWIKTKKMKKTTMSLPTASASDDTGRDSSVSRSSSSSISLLRLNSKEQLKLSRVGKDLFSGQSCFNFKPRN